MKTILKDFREIHAMEKDIVFFLEQFITILIYGKGSLGWRTHKDTN